MKRVLLASALATMALAANAQAQEVLRSSNGFKVISKNFTTSGKNILYSSSGDSKDETYTIYDDNFLQTKTFSFTGKEFSCKTVGKKALATISKKTLESIDYDDVYRDESKSINTMEEMASPLSLSVRSLIITTKRTKRFTSKVLFSPPSLM